MLPGCSDGMDAASWRRGCCFSSGREAAVDLHTDNKPGISRQARADCRQQQRQRQCLARVLDASSKVAIAWHRPAHKQAEVTSSGSRPSSALTGPAA